jgi:AcrR family transcriptional regulator
MLTVIEYYDNRHSQEARLQKQDSRGKALAANVKQTMIERTAVLLAKKGLQGASFSEILEASGAPRGSLYHHFPGGKDELVLAALEHAGNQALGVLDRLSGKPAREVAEGFLSLWRSVLARSDFSAGCAVVAVTVAAESEDLRARAAAILRGWREKLVTLFIAGGIPKKKARAVAASLVAACEGAVILARAERSFEPFDLVAAEQLSMIEAAAKSAS